jgi:voltage-gated potassium channel
MRPPRTSSPPARRQWRRQHYNFQPLRRATRIPVWGDLGIRLALAIGLIMMVVMIHWLDRDGLVDHYDGEVTFLDVVYFTMISVTTTGFGDIAPVSDSARLVEAVIVTPIRFIVFFIFVGTAYQFIIRRSWEKWRMARIQKHLTNHIVVLGYGVSGSQAVAEIIERGTDPHCIVVIDPSEERLEQAERLGCNILAGDASRDDTLNAVRIAEAASVLVSAGRDDTSILIVLTVRHLAPKVPISVVVRAGDNELLARQAGADNVINPVRFTGLLLAGSANGAHTADYLADLASVGGRVQLVERPVGRGEVGKRLCDLDSGGVGLRIYRGEEMIGFWEGDAVTTLRPGDVVVEIVPTLSAEAG